MRILRLFKESEKYMTIEKDTIRKILVEEIESMFNISIIDLDENLLNQNLGIDTFDLLYLLNMMNEKFKVNVYKIIERNDSKVFTVNNLAEKIEEMYFDDNRNN